jgi:hypothetical protein
MLSKDVITKEKQRVSEALARIDTQRARLADQLAELETAERVIARHGKGARPKKMAPSKTPETKAAAPAQLSGRRRSAVNGSAANRPTPPTLGDRVLALATGKTRQEITAACKGARPNHVGVVIARHKRAGRIEERDGKLYAAQSTAAKQKPV